MSIHIDLSAAMRMAAGELQPSNPFEEVAAISHLHHQFQRATLHNRKIEGYTAWQLRDAASDMLRRQDYTSAFVTRIESISDHLSGAAVPQARQESDYLRTLAHWTKADKHQRIEACRQFASYMVELANERFDFNHPLRIDVRSMRQGPAHELDAVTQQWQEKVLAVNPYYDPNTRGRYIIEVNTHPRSTFSDAVKTLGSIHQEGMMILQGEIAKHYLSECVGNKIPSDKLIGLDEDRQRLGAFYNSNMHMLAYTHGAEAMLPQRFAQEQTMRMVKDLAPIIDNGKSFDPPSPRGLISRMLGL